MEQTCPRCGARFSCRADDIAVCACTAIYLTPEQRLVLQSRYTGCLCPECLKTFAEAPEKVFPKFQ